MHANKCEIVIDEPSKIVNRLNVLRTSLLDIMESSHRKNAVVYKSFKMLIFRKVLVALEFVRILLIYADLPRIHITLDTDIFW